MNPVFPNQYFKEMHLVSMLDRLNVAYSNFQNRPCAEPHAGWCERTAGELINHQPPTRFKCKPFIYGWVVSEKFTLAKLLAGFRTTEWMPV